MKNQEGFRVVVRKGKRVCFDQTYDNLELAMVHFNIESEYAALTKVDSVSMEKTTENESERIMQFIFKEASSQENINEKYLKIS